MIKLDTFFFSFLFFSIISFGQNNAKHAIDSLKSDENVENSIVISFDSIPFTKSSEMLDEEMYWEIVQNSIKENSTQEDQELLLVSEIEKLSPKEIVGFRLRTDKLLFDTYNSKMWCAAYIMNGGCSDDGFEYFRCWLISKGKEVFYNAKSNPDSLLNQVVNGQESYEFEGFWYVAMTAFKYNTGEELYPYIDYEKFLTNEENYPLLNFTWNIEEPKTMGEICPILYKNIWK